MRRAAFFTMATLTSVAVFGQGLLDCIEPDVLRALLLQSQGERPPVITAAVPAELSALKMPREFTWIGSAERVTGRVDATTNATQVTAAWRSSLAPEAARATAATALTVSGWDLRSPLGMDANGFTSGSAQFPQVACHDGAPVEVTANAMDGVTYLLFVVRRGNSNSICNQPARPSGMINMGVARYLPRLEMPVDPATGVAVRTQSSDTSSGGATASAQVRFTVKDSVGDVARQFARQMAEQGWAGDASWSGTATAGSSWSRRVDAGILIHGTLSVTAADDRQFMAMLRVIQLP